MVDRLLPNDIGLSSSTQNQFISRICINEGLANYSALPFVTEADFHISQEEYDRRMNASWPEATPETIIVGQGPPAPLRPLERSPATPQRNPVLSTGSLGDVLRPRKENSEE
jgi:hypothetical protein